MIRKVDAKNNSVFLMLTGVLFHFQCRIVSRKNECLYVLVRAYGTKKFCCCLVWASVSLRWFVGIYILLLTALNISVIFVLGLRSYRSVQFGFLRSEVMLTSLLYVSWMNVASLMWTFSNFTLLSCVCESQAELHYSNIGLFV